MTKNRSVTAAEMREIDRQAIEDYGIPGLILMENAGRGLAELIGDSLKAPTKILVACGKGNNGGDGFVAARHLFNQGHTVHILLFGAPGELKGDAAVNYQIVSRMGIAVSLIREASSREEMKKILLDFDSVVDALFGVGLDRELGEPYAGFIHLLNHSSKQVIALDMPSGIHSDTGKVMGSAVKANITATLGLPKRGLYEGEGPAYAGKIHVIDISLPKVLLDA